MREEQPWAGEDPDFQLSAGKPTQRDGDCPTKAVSRSTRAVHPVAPPDRVAARVLLEAKCADIMKICRWSTRKEAEQIIREWTGE